ncbi:bifunctional 2',3'-cyclic-nucleotide 2'-phosphodiesterase/3'-nucleotidase [Roseovarius salinarum]|uniref:bifunctional 2',3'-cyclic-nucleotide 2'-phosphodiesterase/3'-nucleotidase n=1 Tax=Roseovarius salinarum TaxID=1981892 RepID=UPI001300061D|nr:bifunctional 2',3'-cyclic-nucleotide 2'-phosphodiesterase/3'-nucleotidase [Roseovarius salinarum]
MTLPGVSNDILTGTTLTVRLLETTDVHANLLPYDYYADRADAPGALTRLATLIAAARDEAPNCLLFDNGDFLQGAPIGDLPADPDAGWTGPHPAITAMNALGYDAAGLGNHEFNFGLEPLENALADAAFPVTCANALTRRGATAGDDETMVAPFLLLDRRVTDDAGEAHELRIGVVAVVPPQITTWDSHHLSGRVTSRDMVDAVRARLPQMRAAGAQLVVALAHTGIGDGKTRDSAEHAALQLAGLPGIDAVMGGHSHEVFPSETAPVAAGVDAAAGTLHGTPAVLAGFGGRHLGVIDLRLRRNHRGWQVAGHRSEVRPTRPAAATRPVPSDRAVTRVLAPAHRRTLQLMRRPLGETQAPLHTFLTRVTDCAATRLVTRAKRAALEHALRGTPEAALPVLSVSTAFRAGGRAGPRHFTDIPAGPLSRRHVADLYEFPNTLCGLRVTGADLRDWLERSASGFAMVAQGRADQPLFDPAFPGHTFDVVDGLTYRLDLSQPARYDVHGRLVAPRARRIRDLRFNGRPLRGDAEFVVATNSYRAAGGGPYPAWPGRAFLHRGRTLIRDHLADYIRAAGTIRAPDPPAWSFAPMPGASVVFDTGPGIRGHAEELRRLSLEDLGDTENGFARLRLRL